MNPAKRGLSSAGKTGIVVALILLVLASAYLAPSLSRGSGTQSTSSQSGVSTSSNQGAGLLPLFGNFSQMQLESSYLDNSQGNLPVARQISVEYFVLGKASLGSTQYTKVEFLQVGVGDTVIAWFSPNGGIDRVDVLGDKNYTGPGSYFAAQIYLSAFGLIPAITSNDTLLSMLTKTSQNTTSIGPTQVDVTTYQLAVPTPPYKSITAEYATIPGTNARLAVYLHEKTTDGSEITVQVTSLKK